MKYCEIRNNEIYRYNVDKPKVIAGTQEGTYLPLEDNVPVIDASKQRISGSSYTIQVDKVVKTYTITDIPAEELTAKKIQQGEQYIKDTVKGVVDDFNAKYGVTFDSIYNMAIYKDDVNYPLHTQCDTLTKWQNSMWATARANQPSVIAGTMTDKEFLAALPIAPVV